MKYLISLIKKYLIQINMKDKKKKVTFKELKEVSS